MGLLPAKQRDQILLIVTVLSLGAVGAFYMYFYADRAEQIDVLDKHVAALDSMNTSSTKLAKSGAMAKLRADAKRYETDLALLGQLVPSSNEVPTLLDQVSTAARRVGLELQDVAPAGPQPGEEFDTYKYKLGVIGGYHAIGAFLANIATMERIVAPMNVQLSVTGPRGEKRARPGESLLDARFEIQTYVSHGGGAPLPAVTLKPTQGNP